MAIRKKSAPLFASAYRRSGFGLSPGEYKVALKSVTHKNPRTKKAVVSEVTDIDASAADVAPNGPGAVINIAPTLFNNIERTPLRQTVSDNGEPQCLENETTTK